MSLLTRVRLSGLSLTWISGKYHKVMRIIRLDLIMIAPLVAKEGFTYRKIVYTV